MIDSENAYDSWMCNCWLTKKCIFGLIDIFFIVVYYTTSVCIRKRRKRSVFL